MKMKALAFSTLCVASVLLADDFKTINGKEYKNATVMRVEADGIVLKTKFGISKVYFAELPKEIQERFHYVDPARVKAERDANARARAQKRAKERAEKQRECGEILTKTEQEFEAAEMRAARAYESSEKGTLSGQVFVATKGGENVKLGARHVSLFARDALDDFRAGLSAFVTAKSEELKLDIAAAEEEKEQANTAKEQANTAEEQAKAAVQQAEATQKGIENGISFADGGTALTVARQAVDAAKAALNEASEAVDRATDAVAAAEQKIGSLLAKDTWYHSVDFYFLHLRSPIHTAETDGDGNFTIQVPRTGFFVIAAQAERVASDQTERYYWIQPVSLESQQQRILLSNNNLMIAKERLSLHDE